jgi:ribosomal protein S20
MAAHKPSPHTRYRHARVRLADLEVLRDKLERSRPRTRGKKAAKTRQLNTLARQIPAARGLLTKARNAIAKAASSRTTHKRTASQKRSDAAKRGWSTRRAGKVSPAPAAPATTTGSGKALPFLTYETGVVGVWPPSKDDRSKLGKYWGSVDRLLSNEPVSFDRFEDGSIYDEISGKRLPFITDRDFILAHSDEFNFGLTIYRDRHEFTKFA